MTGTTRIDVDQVSPSTTFQLSADWVSQNQAGNYSTIRIYMRAYNGPSGTTGSTFGGAGEERGSVDGVGSVPTKSGNPFLPSGYAQNALRWEVGGYDLNVGHDAAGNLSGVTVRLGLYYGSIATDYTAWVGGPARIPKPPNAPATPNDSGIGPKSATIDWAAPTDNGGSAVNGYQLQIALSTDTSYASPVVDVTLGNVLNYTTAILNPATNYIARVRAKNGSAGVWSPYSGSDPFKTLSGAYIGKGGSYLGGELYVGKAGAFVLAELQVGKGGVFVPAG